MYAQVEKNEEKKCRVVSHSAVQKKSSGIQGFVYMDNRSRFAIQRPVQLIDKRGWTSKEKIPFDLLSNC